MNILLFGKNHGEHGPTRVSRGLSRSLYRMGHEIKMITYGNRSDAPNNDIEIETLPLPNQSVASWRKLYSKVAELVGASEYDIFHALERYPYQSDIRTVQWTSDSYILWRRAKEHDLNIRTVVGDAILNWESRSGARKASSIIGSSPETKRQMESLWLISPDTIIPPGIDSNYRSSPASCRTKMRVLMVGRFEQRKGYDRVLPLMDPYDPKYEVRIAGGIADDAYAESFLTDVWRDRYLGYINDTELENEYESADIVVIPSYLENFSMVALEAISKGCVVIITRDCGFAQFEWANPENGVYVVDSGHAAVDKLQSLIEDRTIDDKKEAAYLLSNRLTWDSIAEEHINEYNNVLNQQIHKYGP